MRSVAVSAAPTTAPTEAQSASSTEGGLEVRFDALNLTNENTYIYYEDPDGPSGNGSSRRDNSFYNGKTFSLGIRGGF